MSHLLIAHCSFTLRLPHFHPIVVVYRGKRIKVSLSKSFEKCLHSGDLHLNQFKCYSKILRPDLTSICNKVGAQFNRAALLNISKIHSHRNINIPNTYIIKHASNRNKDELLICCFNGSDIL